MRLLRSSLTACCIAFAVSSVKGETFSYVDGWVYSSLERVYDPIGGANFNTIPAAGSMVVNRDGSQVTTAYTFSQQSLRFDIRHLQVDGSVSNISHGFIHFRPSNDMYFSLSGIYNMLESVGYGEVRLNASLYDASAATYIFQNEQVGNLLSNERFTIGETAGSSWNHLSGSASGRLLAGKAYQFGFEFRLSTSDWPGGRSAEATGHVSMQLSDQPIGVPLPASFLGGVALIGLLSGHRARVVRRITRVNRTAV